MTTPLYGHNSEETAYMVSDYPYGYSARCRIRYWVENGGKKGYRFVSQTENPKTLRWNAPKKGTYSLVAEAICLDENGHVKLYAIDEYTKPEDVQRFIELFPGMDPTMRRSVLTWAKMKAHYNAKAAKGELPRYLEGDAATEKYLREAEQWENVIRAFPSGEDKALG